MKRERNIRLFNMKRKNSFAGLLFFSPWIAGFIFFTLYPVIYALMLSFNEVIIRSQGIKMTFRGWSYFITALREDTVFPLVLGEAVLFICASVPVIVVFSLIISLLINQKFRGRTFFRAVFFLPVIIMSGPVFSELLARDAAMTLEPSRNIVYQLLTSMPEDTVRPILYILDNLVHIMWLSGVQIIIFLAGLQKINPDMYEAASIDGASSWEKFWIITLPHIRPIICINTIFTIIEVYNFSNIAVNQKILSHMFEVNRPFSYSSAMSWIYFVVTLIILVAGFLITFDWSSERRR